jgi:hypothetical protein
MSQITLSKPELAMVLDGLTRLYEHYRDLADTDAEENRAAWATDASAVNILADRLEGALS